MQTVTHTVVENRKYNLSAHTDDHARYSTARCVV